MLVLVWLLLDFWKHLFGVIYPSFHSEEKSKTERSLLILLIIVALILEIFYTILIQYLLRDVCMCIIFFKIRKFLAYMKYKTTKY